MNKNVLINLEIIARQLCKMNNESYNNERNWVEPKYKEEK